MEDPYMNYKLRKTIQLVDAIQSYKRTDLLLSAVKEWKMEGSGSLSLKNVPDKYNRLYWQDLIHEGQEIISQFREN